MLAKENPGRRLLATVLGLALLCGGCDMMQGGGNNGNSGGEPAMHNQASRVQKMSYPLSKGAVLDVETGNGTILVTGGGGMDCQITASILVQASSQREAQDIASRVRIAVENTKDGLAVRSESLYATMMGQQVSVNYEIALPGFCGFTGKVQNGSIAANTLSGPLKLACGNGNITIRECTGPAFAKTENGQVNCTGLKGECDLKSGNGGVLALYAANATSANIRISSHNGGIELAPPRQLSASLDMSAKNGTIRSAWPVKQSFVDKHMKGTLGKGEDKVVLATENGSIVVRETQ